MAQKHTHIFLVLVFLLFSYKGWSVSIIPVQEPEVYRTFDDDFKERYSSDKYNYEGTKIVNRTKPGSGQYEDYKKEKIKNKEQDNSESIVINLGPFWWIFIFILIGAVLYLAYVLLNEGGTGLFAKGKNKTIHNHDEITAENIEHADILSLIKKAENDNDYRLAIRYYYLLTLKTLSLKKHIKFEDDKTNAEYLNEISDKPFSKGFSYASYLYNYIWYGKFNLEALQYAKAKDNFTSLLNQVK
ncbi:hypothetical protein [Hyunsoonleella pacifica]|uniref:DUF4129 domain-containing protein n=1 Tax=Hyunsoonleella pacifica TaxID=1080224 RepID=A0A4Q9FJA6_9FLAO|nr:hypothetical protein [Hyunsoonleella pacifica]TBN13032.1 hypothetical protein EYD46_16140 [Hyunsoonleella pacifica]GGD27722.1 hypothetical protein GCM10011368_32160 [Hyunsoonleella pacifica]